MLRLSGFNVFYLRITPVLFAIGIAIAADGKETKKEVPYEPRIHSASNEGQEAIKRFQFAKNLSVDLWAAEPLLANPVCFCFDEKGRCFVAETFRYSNGVTDNRSHMNWLDEDLASRTVADRVALYKKDAREKFAKTYEKERDRIRLLEDTTGSGRADKATVFRDDFGRAEDGIGAGLLARNGKVYFTDIPDLWLLKDSKGADRADVKQSLSTGYGVHVSFVGHDLHGLRMGPDGLLYFSLGDRGMNVLTKEGKRLFYPDTGAVLRCELDGANLEVVHSGLRNPQELAFDDHGNLFTVDNNSDSGDRARFVYIVEGGDSGWRIGYQYGSEMHDPKIVKQGNRGPFNYEKLWYPHFEGQAAYIVPPLNNFADGPSGFCHYPGVGLADEYKGHFFLCDFRGNSSGSGVWNFTTKPKGAAFEMVNPRHFVWQVLATDCDFGPDCSLYISDWTEGWGLPGKGRIYKVSDPAEQQKDNVGEVKQIFARGFNDLSVEDLTKLLEHAHQQIRLEAQFAIVEKRKASTTPVRLEPFVKVAKESKHPLARLHAIWGMGMIARADAAAYETLMPYLKDNDAEVRAQAAKMLGPKRPREATRLLIELLKDSEPRVQFFALQSLAKTQPSDDASTIKLHRQGVDAIVRLAKENADKDPYLRHGLARALAALMTGLGVTPHLDESPSVRMVALLADRYSFAKAAAPDKSRFGELADIYLSDSDPRIVAEIARAIHDLELSNDYPKLAALINRPNVPVEALYRSLNVNFRLGKPENALALAVFAARTDASEPLRILALKMLGAWAHPPRRDFITGLTQSLKERDASSTANAFKAKLAAIFAAPPNVQNEAAKVAARLGITEVGPFLFRLVTDVKAPATYRIEALNAIEALKDNRIEEAVKRAIASDDPRLRNAGRRILMKSKPAEVAKDLQDVLAKGDIIEKQGALELLANIKSSDVDAVLESWLDKLIKKEAPAELQLDIIEAVNKRNSIRLQRRLKSFEQAKPKNDDLAPWRETLHGGDAERGRQIFLNNAAVSCQRCHKLDGEGGEVGPPLNGIAAKQKRDYLLESIVLPNKQIAKGFESILITKTDGKSISGVLKSEDAREVKVMTAEGQLITVKKDEIDERRATKTAMPEDVVQNLSKRELRDLVEFLAGLKEEWKK